MQAGLVTYAALVVAIAFEVLGTTFLQKSAQFTRPISTGVMALSYLAAFYFLSIALREIPVGVAYAIWSGLGIVLISIVGVVVFGQHLDLPAVVGLGLIIVGVIMVNGISKAGVH